MDAILTDLRLSGDKVVAEQVIKDPNRNTTV